MTSLEFIIPVYERLCEAIKAYQSIASQLNSNDTSVSVKIVIWDDASPSISDEDFYGLFKDVLKNTRTGRNRTNLGMSANIRMLVEKSSADFVTVLTDDDLLEINALREICRELESIETGKSQESRIAAIVTPRYCYPSHTKDYFITDALFDSNREIPRGALSAIRYCTAAHVLTGAILRRCAIDLDRWKHEDDNAYFPVIYFGALALKNDTKYVNAKWFRHTVFNVCHWDAWGKTQKEIDKRLLTDYNKALQVVFRLARQGKKTNFLIIEKAIIGAFYNRVKSQNLSLAISTSNGINPDFCFNYAAAVCLSLIRRTLLYLTSILTLRKNRFYA